MKHKKHRDRGSGAIRRLPSGRWQLKVMGADGVYVTMGTYPTKHDAQSAARETQVDQERGQWIDPRAGQESLSDYADRWLADRTTLRPRTRELYEGLLRLHVLPSLGHLGLSDVSPSLVRAWHGGLMRAGAPGPVTVAKAYRLLKTIMGTAVEDELIGRNPCVVKGAGVERSPERPVATVEEVRRLVEVAPDHMKALILVATYGSLRLGELAALVRRNVDLDAGVIHVVASAGELRDGSRIVGEPKSDAGRRSVTLPATIVDVLREHVGRFAEPGDAGLVFVGPKGGPLRRGNFNVAWRRVVAVAGLDALRFHDLRHTGNTMAATTGASTRELMARMGHSSARARLSDTNTQRPSEIGGSLLGSTT